MRKLIAATLLWFAGCAMADFRAAEEMLRQHKYYNAIEHYITFVRANPEHRRAPEALYQAGNIQQVMLDEPDKALLTYQKLVSLYPVNEYTLRAQRRVAELQKDHFANIHQAIIEYEKLLHAAPNHPDAAEFQFEIAKCYTMLHNFDQAFVEYRTLVEKYPTYTKMDEVYFKTGDNAYIAGKYADAITAYETVERRYPNSPLRARAIFGIAQSYEGMDDIANAKRRYKEIEKEYPSPTVVSIRLAGLERREAKMNKPGAPLK
jgi:TolA-binding protein